MPRMHNPAHPGEILCEFLPEEMSYSLPNPRLRLVRASRLLGDFIALASTFRSELRHQRLLPLYRLSPSFTGFRRLSQLFKREKFILSRSVRELAIAAGCHV